MRCSISFLRVVLVFVVLSIRVPVFADMTSEKRALESAQLWLTAVDDGRYAESWEAAAEYFRNAVSREQWQQSLNAVRKPLGKVINRSVKTKQYTTSLPGAPDGKYVVIQFETSFANKKASVETVTPMLDKDGTWRVSGYYIK
jgi:hypothetical protein